MIQPAEFRPRVRASRCASGIRSAARSSSACASSSRRAISAVAIRGIRSPARASDCYPEVAAPAAASAGSGRTGAGVPRVGGPGGVARMKNTEPIPASSARMVIPSR